MNEQYERKAKEYYVKQLEQKGFVDVQIVQKPSDIIAFLNGEKWYFEIKATKKEDRCFGAATFTEWKQAFATPSTYRFVIVQVSEDETKFKHIEFTPEEFLEFSSIPPIKVNFNIDFIKMKKNKKHMTKESFEILSEAYNKTRE